MVCRQQALGLRQKSGGVATESRLDAPLLGRHHKHKTSTAGLDLGKPRGCGAPTRQIGAVHTSNLVAEVWASLRRLQLLGMRVSVRVSLTFK